MNSHPKLPLIPVLDVLQGQVVRAIGGRRNEYLPIRSRLLGSTRPLDVANAMLKASQNDQLYVADLDGILEGTACRGWCREVLGLPIRRLLLDAGVRQVTDVEVLRPLLERHDSLSLVLGTETLAGPSVISELRQRYANTELLLSLDLFDGELRGIRRAWGVTSAEELAVRATGEWGVRELIVLDLARVGEGQGAGTEALVERIVSGCPGVRVLAGGGLRDYDDCRRLVDAGADGLLVASMLHDA